MEKQVKWLQVTAAASVLFWSNALVYVIFVRCLQSADVGCDPEVERPVPELVSSGGVELVNMSVAVPPVAVSPSQPPAPAPPAPKSASTVRASSGAVRNSSWKRFAHESGYGFSPCKDGKCLQRP